MQTFDSREVVNKDNSNNLTTCKKCKLLLDGLFVNALGHCFHLNCFVCIECGEIITSRFVSITTKENQLAPLCEKDYYKTLSNKCSKCNNRIEGPFIIAKEKKFHKEHFACFMCNKAFDNNEDCYEYQNDLLCLEHYTLRARCNCLGCNSKIIGKFVENEKEDSNDKWHPECYMINKFWSIKLSDYIVLTKEKNSKNKSSKEKDQNTKKIRNTEEKAQQIWSIVSSYEESAASCISDLLLNISKLSYRTGVKLAKKFVMHIEILYNCIGHIDSALAKKNDTLKQNDEPKILIDKITSFFFLLTESNEAENSEASKTLLTLITGVAHYLKTLIRLCLIGALKMDGKYNSTNSYISRLLKMFILHKDITRVEQWEKLTEAEALHSSKKCYGCKLNIEDECYKIGHLRMHKECIYCNNCKKTISPKNSKLVTSDSKEISCENCPPLKQNFKIRLISKYDQYVYNLRVSLKELTKCFEKATLCVDNEKNKLEKDNIPRELENKLFPELLNRELSKSNDEKSKETCSLPSKKPEKKSHEFLKKIESESDDIEFTNDDFHNNEITSLRNISIIKVKAKKEGDYNRSILSHAIFDPSNEKEKISIHKSKDTSIKDYKFYLSYMSVLECFIIKHLAVFSLHKYVSEWYSFDDLLELIGSKKSLNLWSKFRNGLKQNKKKSDEVFGVPLSSLTDRTGCLLPLGAHENLVTIPRFAWNMIEALQNMDLGVEGLFRKNGNIRRLKELKSDCDLGIYVNLNNEGPIQTAALFKKFLRDMPDSLTTCKLYELFLTTQKISDFENRKTALHLVFCMIPSCNRDMLEAFLVFIKKASKFSEKLDGSGSKMDISNMATVITPSLLYPFGKEPIEEEEQKNGVKTVQMLLENVEEFSQVPQSVSEILREFDFREDAKDLSPKTILKKCQLYMSKQKSFT